ncbi:MAG: hypothetical protein JNM00_13640, partial [Flavobacteriales bacterium]|nr:hypothetical protein [Flavobacteriales bacterium]
SPQGISYQAIVRDNGGNPLPNQLVTFRFNVHDQIPGGAIVYSETHNLFTNEFGLVNLVIGGGAVNSGVFQDIDWGGGSKFLQVELDPSGGNAFSDMGTTQMLSVPYALYSGSSADAHWDTNYYGIHNSDGGNVGIGTTLPWRKLTVEGGDARINDIDIGQGNVPGLGNLRIGGLEFNTLGTENTAVGQAALYYNTTGNANTAIGLRALINNDAGNDNTSVGLYSMYNTQGNGNVALGNRALEMNIEGNNNTAIGNGADVLSTNLENATAIGWNARVGSSNSLVLGNEVNVGIGTSNPQADLHIVDPYALIQLDDEDDGSSLVILPPDPTGGGTGGIGTTTNHDLPLFTNNLDRLTIKADGNVGIGTPSPIRKLTVQTDGEFGYGFTHTNGIMDVTTYLQDGGWIGTVNNVPLHLFANDSWAALTVAPSSNVGIGTTIPEAKLDIAGNLKITDGTQGDGKVLTSDANGFASWQTFSGASQWSTSGNNIFNNNSGYVGIGTSTPADRLSVVGSGNEAISVRSSVGNYTVRGGIKFGTTNPSYQDQWAGILSWSEGGPDQASLSFYTSYGTRQERMFIAETGEIGIGTNNPLYKLHVVGPEGEFRVHPVWSDDVHNTALIGTFHGTGNDGGQVRFSGVGSQFVDAGMNQWGDFQIENSSDAAILTATQSQRVGIGTDNPYSKLHVETGTSQVYIHGTGNNDETWTNGFPLFVDGGNNGLLIRVDDEPVYASNDFISFWSSANNEEGRIEGFNPSEYDFDDFSICELNEFFGPIPTDPFGAIAWGINLETQLICMAAGGDGVTYASGFGDYAECLEKMDPNEKMTFGDVVGVRGGKISKNTEGAEQVMSISLAPIVLGKLVPHDSLEYKFEKVGFMGQVPVKVRGTVESGDYIVASGNNDGTAIAVNEEDLTLDMISQILGRSWESSANEKLKFVNVVVGVKGNELQSILKKQQERIDNMESKMASFMEEFSAMKQHLVPTSPFVPTPERARVNEGQLENETPANATHVVEEKP